MVEFVEEINETAKKYGFFNHFLKYCTALSLATLSLSYSRLTGKSHWQQWSWKQWLAALQWLLDAGALCQRWLGWHCIVLIHFRWWRRAFPALSSTQSTRAPRPSKKHANLTGEQYAEHLSSVSRLKRWWMGMRPSTSDYCRKEWEINKVRWMFDVSPWFFIFFLSINTFILIINSVNPMKKR